MAWTDTYANFDLVTGNDDGTSAADAWQTMTSMNAEMVPGDRVNLKRQASPFDLTATFTFNTAGTVLAPIWIRAYASSIGDGGIWECAYNSGGTANLIFSGNYQQVEGVNFKAGASSNQHKFDVSGDGSWAIRCKAACKAVAGGYSNVYWCWFSVEGNTGFIMAGVNGHHNFWNRVLLKRVGATTSTSLVLDDIFGTHLIMRNCVLIGNGNANENGLFIDRADSTRGFGIVKNRFYNFDSGILVDEQPNAHKEDAYIMDNLFQTMAAYGVERVAADAGYVHIAGNYYRSCTSGFTNYAIESEVFGNTALSADAFETPGSDDLAINAVANGGQVLRDVEEDYDPTGDVSDTTQEVFGDWYEHAAGGGGSLLVHPGMSGGMRG